MKIEAGKYYRNAAGEKVGPIEPTVYDDGSVNTYWPWTVGTDLKRFWRHDGKAWGTGLDLVSEWTDEPTGPVRVVTSKAIVPGTYVAVKPLVWGEFGGEGFVREEAECILGLYRLAQSRVTGEWHWSLNELDGPWSLALPTPEAARDEAQQDYETRIRGALA